MKFSRFLVLVLATLLSALTAHSIAATVVQSTAFTYQGQLNAGGILPAGQTFQFTFTLYDAASGGNVVGDAISRGILVGNGGLFTADLDFGQIFNGTQYWLDIQVGTTVANKQALTARQPINTVPVAQYALNTPPGTFAEFYHTSAGGVAIPFGGNVPFSNTAVSNGNAPIAYYGDPGNPLTITQFIVQAAGTYEISFELTTNDAGGDAVAIAVNNVVVPYAQTAQPTKVQAGKFMVLMNAGDVLSLLNVAVSTMHLDSLNIGATDANLVIKLMH